MFPKTSTLLFLFALFSVAARAQSFEGIIEFKKQTGKDLVNYVYYVKNEKVRIDEFSPGTRNVEASFILDTKASTMMYLDHPRKIWGMRPPKGTAAAPAGCVASSTKTPKEILGYKCSEQVITNQSDSTQISYFMATGKFDFFLPMMKLLNRKEDFSTYYFAIPSVKEGSMPLLAIEKNLDGTERSRLEVTRLEQKTISASLFDAPKDYTEVK